ncbi:hypothetical protein D030_3874B, partial [Vibrio parahaemolyticus AQ3810]
SMSKPCCVTKLTKIPRLAISRITKLFAASTSKRRRHILVFWFT